MPRHAPVCLCALCSAGLVGAQRTVQNNINVKSEPNTLLVNTLQYMLSTFELSLRPFIIQGLAVCKMDGEGLGERVTCVTSGRREGGGGCLTKNLEGPILSKNLRLTFERQCQYSSFSGLEADQRKVCELQWSGTAPPHVYPHVYLTSRTWLSQAFPPFLHTASDQKRRGDPWEKESCAWRQVDVRVDARGAVTNHCNSQITIVQSYTIKYHSFVAAGIVAHAAHS